MSNASWLETITGETIKRDYERIKRLGQGSEGVVFLYKRRGTHSESDMIAIKYPTKSGFPVKQNKREIENLKKVREHPNIIKMLGYDLDWSPTPPAIFLEYYRLGDLHSFRQILVDASIHRVPEDMAWSVFLDIARGLDHIHNQLGITYVHNDLKPGNILVQLPAGYQIYKGEIMENPQCKIADFARMVPYSPSKPQQWFGTPEYAPPVEERKGPLTPGFDIWGLGGILSFFIWNQSPLQSRESFIKDQEANGRFVPQCPEDWINKKVRDYRPVVCCPINLSKKEQKQILHRKYPQEPYSDELQEWYTMCMDKDTSSRISSKDLRERFTPWAERKIRTLRQGQKREHKELEAKLARKSAYRKESIGAIRLRELNASDEPELVTQPGFTFSWNQELEEQIEVPTCVRGSQNEEQELIGNIAEALLSTEV